MTSSTHERDGNHPLVGVIGGVGPLATVYFLDKVVRLTAAERDQDHVDLVVFNHATIPDRTAYILGSSSENPGPVMASDARRLERFGVSFLVIPCNTAAHFTDEIVAATRVPILSIVDETVAEAHARRPGVRVVGLLATSGTGASGVYQKSLADRGIACLLPDEGDQATVSRIIYEQVKSGQPVDIEAFRAVVAGLLARGAELVLLGCTELSVVAEDEGLLGDPLFVDSLDVLARRTIERAGGQVRG